MTIFKMQALQSLKPYSHKPGVKVLVPNSKFVIQVFPSKISILDADLKINEFSWKVDGPVSEFLVTSDLENTKVLVDILDLSRRKISFELFNDTNDQLILKIKKVPDQFYLNEICVETGQYFNAINGQRVRLPISIEKVLTPYLHFGCHKTQNIDCCENKSQFKTWLPILYKSALIALKNKCAYYNLSSNFVEDLKPENFLIHLFKILKFHHKDLGVVVLNDDLYQGIDSPLSDLKHTSEVWDYWLKIVHRMLFFKENQNFYVLSKLPPELDCGKFYNISTEEGIISFEWTKKYISKFQILPKKNAIISLCFRHVKACRAVNIETKEKQHFDFANHKLTLEVFKDQLVVLDHFLK